jgi:BRCA1-associated protein
MDDTTGLMTIPCQHVFHCTCLQNWKGSGCPVCRHTNPEDSNEPYTKPFGSDASNLCSVCDSAEDLWICLICGIVGCGRYKGGHAKDHWKETAHSFALELETQHVWDYAGDMWVHRLIRDKGDGKVVELPGSNNHGSGEEDEDVVPRAKLDNIGREYTHLLASQLESQRVYFEEMLSKVADKAAKASSAAEDATAQASAVLARVTALEAENRRLQKEVIPQLERDGERDRTKAAKASELARSLGKSLQEEKQVSEGLMRRIEHVQGEMAAVRTRNEDLVAEVAELKETNRDLTMFISGQERLKELEEEGKVDADELAEGSIGVAAKKGRRKGKK